MAEQYTPTTELVRDIWLSALWEGMAGEGTEDAQWEEDRRLAQFDRWLAAHDAQVLRDAADVWHEPHDPSTYPASDWLAARADRIAGGTSA